jgi:outer membrane protein assembly factor BamD
MKTLIRIAIVLMTLLTLSCRTASAFWVWTPETNKWVNPKFSVKETPKEQFAYAMGFYEAGDLEKARVEFSKLIKHYPRAREAADAQYYLAKMLEDQGQLYKAFGEYQVVIEKYPFSERAGDIIERQYRIGTELMEGREKRNKIINVVVGGDYDVINVFRTVIKNAPYGKYAAPAQYKIGLWLQEKQLYQEARDEFEKTINDYPESEWAEAARFQIAMSDSLRSSEAQYDQQVTKVAIDQFKDFVEENPDAELSQSAREQIRKLREKEAKNNFLVAQFYEKHKKYDAAKVYYNTIVQDYKTTTWAPRALEKLQTINQKL